MITENKWDTPGPFLRWFVCWGKGKGYIEKVPNMEAARARGKEIQAGLQNRILFVIDFVDYVQIGWEHIDYWFRFFESQVMAKGFAYEMKKQDFKIYALARQAPKDHVYWLSMVAKGHPLGWNLLKPGEYHPKPRPTSRAGAVGGFQDAAQWDP